MSPGGRRLIVCLCCLAGVTLPAASAQFLVAQDGSGTHTTIQGALNAAGFGDTIIVKPGTYEEGIRFRNGVQLIGAGPGQTIIRFGYGFDPVVQAEHASSGRIEGFTIERTGSTLGSPAVRLESASITIAHCAIAGAQESGIEIINATSSPTIEDTTICSNGEHGVWARAGARVELARCTIERNGGVGLLLTDDAVAIVVDTTFATNDSGGIHLSNSAAADVSAGRVEGSPDWGIRVADSASLTLVATEVSDNASGGALLEGHGAAVLRAAFVRGDGVGIEVRDDASLDIRDSTIREAAGTGLVVRGASQAAIERVEVDGCGEDGIDLASSGAATVAHATIVRCGAHGIEVEGSNVSVTDSIVTYNDGAGIAVRHASGEPSELLLSHNDVWGNGDQDYQGTVPRPTDLSSPPEFTDLDAGDLTLRLESECIGRGTYGGTIGAHADPSTEAGAVVEAVPRIEDAFLGFDVGARVRLVPAPALALETVELFASYDEAPWTVAVRSSLAGAWGRRTSGRLYVALAPWGSDAVRASARFGIEAVLAGIESWACASVAASFSSPFFALAAELDRRWPSDAWSQDASLRLGGDFAIILTADAVDFSPRNLSLALERRVSAGDALSSFSGTLSLGAEKAVTLRGDWERGHGTISAEFTTYLDRLDCASAAVDVVETDADASVRLAARFADACLADGSVSASKGFGRTTLGFGLGVNADGLARASFRIEVGFGGGGARTPNLLPLPSFIVYPDDPQAGEPVSFDASHSADPDGTVVDYWWDYGDGEAELGRAVEHVFSEPRTYEVALTVVDEDGATATLVRSVEVWPTDSGPLAAFIWEPVSAAGTRLPRPPRAGDRIRLDASESDDPGGGPLEFHWDLDSDGAFDLITAKPLVVIDPLPAGSQPVTLRVVNPAGRADAVMHAIVVAEPKPPQARFSLSPASPSVLDPIRFEDQSVDADGDVVAWEWSFGDGRSSREQAPTHRYDEPGQYAVALTVTDDDGLNDEFSQIVEVALVPEVTPVAAVWVLAIGVSDYDNVPDLQFGREDALAVTAWALDQGVPPENIRLLTDNADPSSLPVPVEAKRATLLNVREALGWLRQVAARDDLVLVFFSGHGYQGLDDGDDERDGVDEFFVLVDTVDGAIDDTALRDDEFGRFLDRLVSEHVLVFFDGCHSGGLARSLPSGRRPAGGVSDIFRDFNLEGRLVFSAATETQEAFESAALGHGVFTYFVLDGLRGRADLNGDRRVTAWELYEFLLAEVPAFVKRERGAEQVPAIVGEGDVRVLLSRRPDELRPSFSYLPTVPFVGGPVRFRDETSEPHTVVEWRFGDGTWSSESGAVHVYDAPGTYDVELTVADSEGETSSAALAVAVAPPGTVVESTDGGWIVSLGAQNGVRPGDVLSTFPAEGSETAVVLEIIEILGSDAALCRAVDDADVPALGEAVRIVSDTDLR